MAARVRTTPLLVALSIAVGASVGVVMGLWVLSWGVAIGVAGALAVLSFGLVREPGHRELFLVLVAAAALDVGLLAATIPTTLFHLEGFVASRLPSLRPLAAAAMSHVRISLVERWITMGALLPVALAVLVRDARKRR